MQPIFSRKIILNPRVYLPQRLLKLFKKLAACVLSGLKPFKSDETLLLVFLNVIYNRRMGKNRKVENEGHCQMQVLKSEKTPLLNSNPAKLKNLQMFV